MTSHRVPRPLASIARFIIVLAQDATRLVIKRRKRPPSLEPDEHITLMLASWLQLLEPRTIVRVKTGHLWHKDSDGDLFRLDQPNLRMSPADLAQHAGIPIIVVTNKE